MADAIVPFADTAKGFSHKKLPASEVELAGDVPYEAILPYRERALAHLAEHVDLPGFRKGKVPPEMALKRLGESAVLEEAVEMFIKDFYPALLEHKQVPAVGRPEIRITKLAPLNPVGLLVRATVYPEVVIPKNYKKLGEKVPLEAAVPGTEEEVNATIEQLRTSRKKDEAVPELDDKFAKSLGAFENVDALKAQLKKGITEEKERTARDARRGKIIDALLEETKVEVPRIFIESELEKILGQMREDVARFGLTFEGYLQQVGKTEEALREEFKAQAEKRAKLQLALNKIAEEEKVEPDKEAADAEIQHALTHFPDANPELVRVHIETVLRNEKVLKMLEGESK